MRSGFGLAFVALTLAACSDRPAGLAAQWQCGPIEGISSLKGEGAPSWILIGEFTETSEAPAAVADIACNLAMDGKPLFVGVSDYLGGATDAEKEMLATLEAIAAKGAPLIVQRIGGEDHAYNVHNRNKAEKAWADALAAKVKSSGAARAILLVSRTDAIAEPIPSSGDRFAGYSPMPVFLPGRVLSLEVAQSPMAGKTVPVIRIHREIAGGFHGQLGLASLTRPTLAATVQEGARSAAELREERANEILRGAQAEIKRLMDGGSMDVTLDTDNLPEDPTYEMPAFEAE